MSNIQWDDEYSVGVRAIDDQHKELIRIINELSPEGSEGQISRESTTKALSNVLNYIKTHFAFEEELMKRHNYPDVELHCEKHKALLQETVVLVKKHHQGEASVANELTDFLIDWLIKHIRRTDKNLGLFLISRK